MNIEIYDLRTKKLLETFSNLRQDNTIADIKKLFEKSRPKYYSDRQAYKRDEKGQYVKDNVTLRSINSECLFFKDLGPQIGWRTVFMAEYAGPILVYLSFFGRPAFIYGVVDKGPIWVVQLAAICWVGHYTKRLLETIFVHRFSHNTMPVRNLFKNCLYYWGFSAFIAYYINHPLYTPAELLGSAQVYTGLGVFLLGELGNFSIHMALRNLRPAGSTVRCIPKPTVNPFTWLFHLVSCPNYTYETMAWVGFSIMVQSVPAVLFTIAGFYQMSVWAIGKHVNYKKEFLKDYPRGRRAIIPFIL